MAVTPDTTKTLPIVPPSLQSAFAKSRSQVASESGSKSLRQTSLLDFAQRATYREIMRQQNHITEKYGEDPEVLKSQAKVVQEQRKEHKQG
jgi:hypothetical protein